MKVSLDTNVWIFGILKSNEFCQRIMLNLLGLKVVIPNQVRMELIRNLPEMYVKEFYQLVNESGAEFNYDPVPQSYITMFEDKGLKKGDAVIGGFCEWQDIAVIVSDNRDFLRGLSAGHVFEVMSPQAFCKRFEL